jgi:DNA-binding MarR family transcriptional regulator
MASTEAQNKQIEQIAEEIFELTKLSWIAGANQRQRDEYDLTESEFLTLDMLIKRNSVTVGELQRSVGVLPAQMSRIIRSLERKPGQPLVACSLNPDDKRKIDVTLTDAGRKAHHSYQSSKLAATIEVLAELEDKDRIEFCRLLRIFKDAIYKINSNKML